MAYKGAKAIAREAWEILLTHKKTFFRLGFLSSFFSLCATSYYFMYQYSVLKSTDFLSKQVEKLSIVAYGEQIQVFATQNNDLFTASIVLLVILFLGWYFIPMLVEGAIANLTHKAVEDKAVRRGMTSALFRFFPLFEAHTIKKLMSVTTFIMIFTLMAQFFDPKMAIVFLPLIIFFATIGMIALFFFSFTTQSIVLEKETFTDSIRRSSSLVLDNFRRTLTILLIILLIELRVLINVVIVLALPFLLVSMSSLFAYFALESAGLIAGAVVAAVAFFITAYLTGILLAYSQIIWSLAFLSFVAEDED